MMIGCEDCELCYFCLYIGKGDFICDREDEPKLVIEDWQPVRKPCKHMKVED